MIGTLNKPKITSSSMAFNPTSQVNLSEINKENIFETNIINSLLGNSFAIAGPKSSKLVEQNGNYDPFAKTSINFDKTNQLNSYLNSLGFNLNLDHPQELSENKLDFNTQNLQIMVRCQEGVYLVDETETKYLTNCDRLLCQNGLVSSYSADGMMVAFADSKTVGIYNFSTNKILKADLPNILALHFSTAMNYLVTIDRREDGRHFLTVFEIENLKKISEFETMKYRKEQWPHLKFTEEDKYTFRALKPTLIEVLDPSANFKVIHKIQTLPFDYFMISPKLENLFIVTVSLEHSAGYEKNEGRIDFYRYSDLKKSVLSKEIDKAHEVNLFFSPDGQYLLLWAQTFTDKSGKSYYGEHVLYYYNVAENFIKKVPTYKGPIHDVCWNPNSMEFIVISGFMPAASVLFDSFCTPKYEFGKHHRNTIKWSPVSRFVCLAGFGNLSGDMEIWDVVSLKQMGTCKANSAVSCQWSPDGRRIMAGVLNPRLRVDNNYKIFNYYGKLLSTVDFSHSELYEVTWRPGKYEDRLDSPREDSEKVQVVEKEKKVFRSKGSGEFAAKLKAEKSGITGGRVLSPDETFGNDDNESLLESFLAETKRPKIIRNGHKSEGSGSEGLETKYFKI